MNIYLKTFFLLFIITIFSCKNNNKVVDNKTIVSNLTDKTEFFSVYKLSKTTTAIVININDSKIKTKFDSIFDKVDCQDSLSKVLYDWEDKSRKNFTYFDTLAQFRLVKSTKLEFEIKKIIQSEYIIYGTKGFDKAKVNEVIFSMDECRTNFVAFTIEKFDTIKNGRPIFCSSTLLNLNYHKDYFKIENKIEIYKKSLNFDYFDKIPTKVFANIDNFYFTYNDDFLWGEYPNKSACNFPERTIYKLEKNNSIKPFWGVGLDLFGIGCD
jgi:hypothetical protein